MNQRKRLSPSAAAFIGATPFASIDNRLDAAALKRQMSNLLKLDFLDRGENVVLIGGIATGKTSLAGALNKAASEAGKTVVQLYDPGINCGFGDCTLESWRNPGKSGFVDDAFQLREDALNCDLLIIDEVGHWLWNGALALSLLVAIRTVQGRSTVLSLGSYSLKTDRERPLNLSYMLNEFGAASQHPLLRQTLFPRLFQQVNRMGSWFDLMGIWFGHNSSSYAHWDSIVDNYNIPDQNGQALFKELEILPFAWWNGASETKPSGIFPQAPTWHVVYLGEKSVYKRL
ncbi:MAG: ATP-binding protein [Candidatus Obscuribacterales bacterium]|nr:ATP-binding protein [Candidatus Obscuribacterales bacterium]